MSANITFHWHRVARCSTRLCTEIGDGLSPTDTWAAMLAANLALVAVLGRAAALAYENGRIDESWGSYPYRSPIGPYPDTDGE